MLLAAGPASHLRPASLIVLAVVAAVVYVLVVIPKPTGYCGRCHGERVPDFPPDAPLRNWQQ